jgi:hypothetical protein
MGKGDFFFVVMETEPCQKNYIVIEKNKLKFSWLQKKRLVNYTKGPGW